MFAVFKTGGKQYRVSRDDVLRVEKLASPVGERVQFDDVMMVGDGDDVTVGAPFIDGAAIEAEIIDQIRGEKVYAFKKRRRKHSSKRLKGHRQYLSVLRISDIIGSGAIRGAQPAVTEALGDLDFDVDEIDTGFDDDVDGAGNGADGAANADAAPSKPQNLLEAPEGAPDDLSKLPDVDEELQMALYNAGVFHFSQIDAWGPAEWAWIEKEVAGGRSLNRSGWLVITRKIVKTRGKPAELPGSRPGNLMQVPDGERDDLEPLPEIGKAREELLYDLGVFHYSQIAAWNDDEIEYVTAWLAERGNKVKSRDWVEKAKELASNA